MKHPEPPEEPTEPDEPGDGEGEPEEPDSGIEAQSASAPVGMADYPWHLGGGYYELSNGERVRGKAEAEEAEKELGE